MDIESGFITNKWYQSAAITPACCESAHSLHSACQSSPLLDCSISLPVAWEIQSLRACIIGIAQYLTLTLILSLRPLELRPLEALCRDLLNCDLSTLAVNALSISPEIECRDLLHLRSISFCVGVCLLGVRFSPLVLLWRNPNFLHLRVHQL